MEAPKSKLHEAVSALVTDRLKLGFSDKSLNHTTCVEIYQMIFDTVVEIIEGSKLKLTNEFVNYVAQEYYDSVAINNNQPLDPDIFSQRAQLSNIETKELTIMALFFRGTDYLIPVVHELKKRG
jgi:hypothetical protein